MKYEQYQVTVSGQGMVIQLRQAANAARFFMLVLLILVVVWWFGPYGIKPSLSLVFYWMMTVFLGLMLLASALGIIYTEEFCLTPGMVKYRNTFGKSRTINYKDAILARVKVASSRARQDSRVFYYQVPLLESNGKESGLTFSFHSEHVAKQFIRWISSHVSLHVVDAVDEDIFREKPLKGFLDKR